MANLIIEPIILAVIFVFSCWLSVTDASKREIPDVCSYGLLVLGLVNFACIWKDRSMMIFSAVAVGSAVVLAVVFSVVGNGIGGGDAKLLVGCSIFMTSLTSLVFYTGFLIVSCIVALVWAAVRRNGRSVPGGPVLAFPLVGAYSAFVSEDIMGLGTLQGVLFTVGMTAAAAAASLAVWKILTARGVIPVYAGEAPDEND